MNLKSIILMSIFFTFSVVNAEVSELKVDIEKSSITWLGTKVVGQHDGNLKLSKGSVTLKDDRLAGGEFLLDMSTIKNQDIEDPGKRRKIEGHLKSDDFFNVDGFPLGSFKITSVSHNDKVSMITGLLTIKGISKEITFPTNIKKENGVYVADAKVSIDRTLWDIRYNSGKFFDPTNLGDKLINDEIGIGLKIVTQQ